MRIDPRHAVPAPLSSARARGPAGTARFGLPADEPPATGQARAAAPLATLDTILALQSDDDPAERRRRSAGRGRDLLDALDGLKAGLLAGRVSAAELSRIGRGLLAATGPSGDPRLDGILAEIELRAKVELAKLGRSSLF